MLTLGYMNDSINTYSGSCVACLTGTDTGLVIAGEAEMHVAAMACWGLSPDRAVEILRYQCGPPPPPPREVRDGELKVNYRVCTVCAARANRVPELVGPGDTPISRELPYYGVGADGKLVVGRAIARQ
jgi:hypothetical protein